MADVRASLREADETSIPAIINLLLTSFRQFSLFSTLYAPLNQNIDAAADTVWFWKRRLLLDLLDPRTSVVLAELPIGCRPGLLRGDDGDEVEKQSWEMLDWLTRNGELGQVDKSRGMIVVGFAIWKTRDNAEPNLDLHTSLKKREVEDSINLKNSNYQRIDQDQARYKAYLQAEDELEENFYKEPCYYLDNLAVDFRYQRLGIGGLLVQWGLQKARSQRLPASTEAGPRGEGLYKKLGFKQVGVWTVTLPDTESIRMPVLRHKLT